MTDFRKSPWTPEGERRIERREYPKKPSKVFRLVVAFFLFPALAAALMGILFLILKLLP